DDLSARLPAGQGSTSGRTWGMAPDPVQVYRDAAEGLAFARGLVAAYERRVGRAAKLLDDLGIALPGDELSEMRLKVVDVTVDSPQPLGQPPADGGVEGLGRHVLAE